MFAITLEIVTFVMACMCVPFAIVAAVAVILSTNKAYHKLLNKEQL